MLQLYEALIQKCTSISTLKKARQLHALLLTTTTAYTSQSPYLNNNLISMYARCGSSYDALLVFDNMPHRNTVSFNALIAAYSRIHKRAGSALEAFQQMENEGLRPNGSTFTSVLQACSSLEDRFMGELCHAQGAKCGFLNDTCVQTSLLGMYSNCGDMEAAREVFSCIGERDAVAWNSLIYGNLKSDNMNDGFYLFGEMVRSGVSPTQFTYSMVLNACGRLGNHSCGQFIHAQLIVSNVLADLPLQNALLDMYSSCGDMKAAFNVFDRMENVDLVSWNSIISGCSENEDGETAISLFLELLEMSLPKPDEYTFAAIVSAIGSFPASDYGKPLHAQIVREGFESSIFVGSTLVSMYFKSGEIESAQKVFNLVSKKDAVIWTEMIVGHSRLAEGESAVKCFFDMFQGDHKIDSFALSGVISACADLASLRQGEMIHSLAVKIGLDVEMSVGGSLVNMYAKTGDLPAARSIFSQVPNPDLKCWNSMLGGCSYHGESVEALKIFEDIQNHGLKPDAGTYLSVLSACAYRGLVDSGKLLWGNMKDNLFPGPRHYSCMVSLLSRAGLVDEAEEMINESPFWADLLESWRTLLSSCVVHRNLQVGIRAAEQALRLDSEDTASHILLSNLYAVSGRWDCVAEMRKKIRTLILEKDPGLSWIEVKNNIHVFSSDDQSHPEFDEAKAELQGLQSNMIIPVTDELIDTMMESG